MFGNNRPLKDDLLHCFLLLIIGLSNYSISYSTSLPESLQRFLDPALIVALVVLLLVSLARDWHRHNMPQEDKRDLERESRDERSLMILSRAALSCKNAEDWLLLILFSLFLVLDRREIAFVFYWALVFRFCLFIAIRWWINRKY